MKALLIAALLSMSVGAIAGPRVTGNGGGGIKKNGVYKTFYSAGVYIDPEEVTDIPGAELYTKTIQSLSGEGSSTASLLSAGLPLGGNRKFYNIAEDRMDDKTMARLIEEYARVVNQAADDLTLFAITDIEAKVTYLLPTFYKLSENEQASILFHEAYWLLNPKADYADVVRSEIAFQEFVEVKESGKYSHKLPRLLGKLLNDKTFSLKSAYEADRILQTAKNLISADGQIKVGSIFIQNKNLCKKAEYKEQVGRTMLFEKAIYEPRATVLCELKSQDLKDALTFQKSMPQSYFLQEMLNYLTQGNTFTYIANAQEISKNLVELNLNKKVDLRNMEFVGTKWLSFASNQDTYMINSLFIK